MTFHRTRGPTSVTHLGLCLWMLARKITTTPDGMVIVENRYAASEWTAIAWRLERSSPERWGSPCRRIRSMERMIAELKRGQAEIVRLTASLPPVGGSSHAKT